MTARPHQVRLDDFAALAQGLDASSDVIRASQLSKRLLVVARVLVAEAHTRRLDLATAVGLGRSADVIVAARRADHGTVDAIVGQPQIGRWAMTCLRRIRDGGLPDADVVDDLAYYGSLAAVVAAEVGVPAELIVRVRADGGLVLPTWGQLRLTPGARWATLRTGPRPRDLTLVDAEDAQPVPPADAGEGGWWPIRRLSSRQNGKGIEVLLDDVDPYRGPPELTAADRLNDPAVLAWQRHLDEAWELLTAHHPEQAEAVARGVSALTPLRGDGVNDELSASTSDGFGGVAMTTPRGARGMATALIHEFQHSKLSGLLDLVPLFESAPHLLFYAPWRTDPRPMRGLIQGAYAHLGLLGFWDRERRRKPETPHSTAISHYEFALWRGGVLIAIEQMLASAQLNTAGLRFVAGMRRRVDELMELDVPLEPASLAVDTAADLRIGWRLRNITPEQQTLDEWAVAWHDGASKPPTPLVETAPSAGRRGVAANGRAALAKLRLAHPERFAMLADDHVVLAAAASATNADAALLCGEIQVAAQRYRERIRSAAQDLDAWAGLALAHRHSDESWAPTLQRHPEVVAGLYARLGAGLPRPPDPDDVATWVAHANG
jgi:HEXXH motif-containing protein